MCLTHDEFSLQIGRWGEGGTQLSKKLFPSQDVQLRYGLGLITKATLKNEAVGSHH